MRQLKRRAGEFTLAIAGLAAVILSVRPSNAISPPPPLIYGESAVKYERVRQLGHARPLARPPHLFLQDSVFSLPSLADSHPPVVNSFHVFLFAKATKLLLPADLFLPSSLPPSSPFPHFALFFSLFILAANERPFVIRDNGRGGKEGRQTQRGEKEELGKSCRRTQAN